MARIVISKSAVDKLIDDHKLRQRWNREPDRRVPCLRYFHRAYSTSRDGTVTELGDGFSLTTIDLEDAKETQSIVLKSAPIADGLHILVGSNEAMMSNSFMIGWLKQKFTYEPLASS